jgi:signal transduction histidine kinase
VAKTVFSSHRRPPIDGLAHGKLDWESNMSHLKTHVENLVREIRSPLSFMLGATERLLESRLSAEERELLERLKSSAESLRQAAEDVLRGSRPEGQDLNLDPVDSRIRDAISGAPNSHQRAK